MPKIDIAKVKVEVFTGYPEPYRQAVAGRERKRLQALEMRTGPR